MREIEKVGVIGAGLMGHALAIVHALGGCNVIMQDLKDTQIAKGLQLIDSALETLVDAGTISKTEKENAKSRITTTLDLNVAVEDADLVVTGEGRFDSQSIRGKAPIGVAKCAKRNRCLVFMIAGSVADDERLKDKNDIDRVFSVVSKQLTLEQALANPSESITLTSISAAKYFRDHY